MPLIIIILLVVIILVLSPFWLGAFVSLLVVLIGAPVYVVYEYWEVIVAGVVIVLTLGVGTVFYAVMTGGKVAASGSKNDPNNYMYTRALSHKYGWGRVEKDSHKAVEWFRQAAESGHAPAMLMLARALRDGEGVARDSAVAQHWLQKAATEGDPVAMLEQAHAFRDGDGVDRDPAAARDWLQKAAAGGNPTAMLEQSRALRDGDGFEKDSVAAENWLRKAAEAGNEDAKKEIAANINAGNKHQGWG